MAAKSPYPAELRKRAVRMVAGCGRPPGRCPGRPRPGRAVPGRWPQPGRWRHAADEEGLAALARLLRKHRRLMNRQLTVQESRHRLARAICHCGRGQIRQAYREGQEDQLAALGLVLTAVVLWNTRYLDAAVAQLRAEGHDLRRSSKQRRRGCFMLGFGVRPSGDRRGVRPGWHTPGNPAGQRRRHRPPAAAVDRRRQAPACPRSPRRPW